MTHLNAGNYAGKHSKSPHLDPRISAALKTVIKDGRLSCSNAHRVAGWLEVDPADVGIVADLMEVKVDKCMLGLFGYNSELPHGKAVNSVQSVSKELETAILDAVEESCISCSSAWEIASRFGISKMSVAAACDALKVKIASCQLGTF